MLNTLYSTQQMLSRLRGLVDAPWDLKGPPSAVQASLTPGTLTTESQQGFPRSDRGRRKKGGFFASETKICNSSFGSSKCALLQLTVQVQ